MQSGQTFGRFGDDKGTYAAPIGTPYEHLSMPYDKGSMLKQYSRWRVKEGQVLDYNEGIAASWFDMPGGGTQYRFNKPISELYKDGIIEPF